MIWTKAELLKYIEAQGMTSADMADLLEVSIHTVRHWRKTAYPMDKHIPQRHWASLSYHATLSRVGK